MTHIDREELRRLVRAAADRVQAELEAEIGFPLRNTYFVPGFAWRLQMTAGSGEPLLGIIANSAADVDLWGGGAAYQKLMEALAPLSVHTETPYNWALAIYADEPTGDTERAETGGGV